MFNDWTQNEKNKYHFKKDLEFILINKKDVDDAE